MSIRSWCEDVVGAVDAKDAKAFAGYLTEDATFKWGARPEVVGNRAVEEYVEGFLAMFDGTRHVLHETMESEDTRVCRGEVTYFTTDGREISTPFCNVLHMDGDLIRDYLIYIDPSPLAAPAD